ncbi:MAG TPA: tetratricopeptide repeat protein [Candidatus Acidoferrum sp.]
MFVLAAPNAGAGQRTASSRPAASSSLQQGIYLVFPFENLGTSPRLDWLGEGLEELTIQNLSAAGQQVYSRAGRTGELEQYGLPTSAKVSRATMLRIAEDLDADFVVFGSFNSDGKSLTVESRILRVEPTSLRPEVRESATLDSLMDLATKVSWRLISGNDRTYPLSLAEFTKLQRPIRLDAFEHYIRGILASEDEARLRELREAARLEPTWPDPDFELGETYFSRNDCTSAIPWFAKVPKVHQRSLEGIFASGVCRLQMNQPEQAEEVFTALQDQLRSNANRGAMAGLTGADIPELLNNLAVARARLGKTAAAQEDLKHASDFDPDEDDYPFNLGLLALRAGDGAGATGYFREAAQRAPDNPEDRAMLIQALEKTGKKAEADQEREAVGEALGPNALPVIRVDAKGEALVKLQRIKMGLDVAALWPEMESRVMTASGTSSGGGAGDTADTAVAHLRRGRQELAGGRLDNAESEFRIVLRLDASSSAAHSELADVDRRRGKLDDAVKELQASLAARDSAVVRTTLARIYLEQNKPDLARAEAERALKLAPNYSAAKQLLGHLQNAKPNGGEQ